jgi:hypothetical protein
MCGCMPWSPIHAFEGLRRFSALERRLLSTASMRAHHELRRSKRVSTYIAVKWCRKGSEVLGRATDLNADGMFFETSETVAPGALMELRLSLPDRELAVFATAVFVGVTASGRGIGVELYMMSSLNRLAWLAYYQALEGAEMCSGERPQTGARPVLPRQQPRVTGT